MISSSILPALLCFTLVVCGIFCHYPEKNIPDIEDYIKFKLQRDHMPGLAVAMVHGQEIIWSKGYGYSNLDLQKKVTGKTIFGTASITN